MQSTVPFNFVHYLSLAMITNTEKMATIIMNYRINKSLAIMLIILSYTSIWYQGVECKSAARFETQHECEYTCGSGECQSLAVLCDGKMNCKDGSDELQQLCLNVRCPSYMFTCRYGACIPKSKVCDGTRDCTDNSDEEEPHCLSNEIEQSNENGKNNSRPFGECPQYMFKCKYGACIERDKVCDGSKDCIDNSDEELSQCLARAIEHSGVNSHIYISTDKRLKRQAADNCEYRCGSGECIGLDLLCDGKQDCNDGSDETKQQCSGVVCPPFLFQCSYGACINKDKVCNGEKDCADNSDEETANCTRPSTGTDCETFEFRCNNGQCINSEGVCDGAKTCADGSDETEALCRPVPCPAYLFKCKYGACVAKTAKCNGIDDCADGSDESDELGCPGRVTTKPTPPVVPIGTGCVLPRHLEGGHYVISSGSVYVENSRVSSNTVIELKCDKGYINSAIKYFFCQKNTWLPSVSQGTCIRACRSLESTETLDVFCFNGRQPIKCENPPEGSTAKARCKPYYVEKFLRPTLTCSGGDWDENLTPCQPVCGEKTVNAETLIISGSEALKGEYPWMVAIYKTDLNSPNDHKHICGGSIISRKYVVSAAHCFAQLENGKPFDRNIFTVAAGKYYREYDHPEDSGVQIRKIKKLTVHEDYKGLLQKHRDDIALLELEPGFDLTPQVQLVCVDWTNTYEDLDLQENQKGVVAGWGYTEEGSSPAEVLKKIVVPFRDTETCRQFMDPDFFHQYFASDKICAGLKDEGKSVCSGDSGGGLYFRNEQQPEPRVFHIRGIVSLSPRHTSGCNSNHYALYTKVSKYLDWLGRITKKKL